MDWPPQSTDLKPIANVWDVMEKTFDPTFPLSIQNLGKKCIQLWMGINVVTLQKLIETTYFLLCDRS